MQRSTQVLLADILVQLRSFQILHGCSRLGEEAAQHRQMFHRHINMPRRGGQSLYSLHLAAMFGHNHAFFDPSVWHDEELRKQVEGFACCCVITGQEAPESSRKLHLNLDLYKKPRVLTVYRYIYIYYTYIYIYIYYFI